MDNETKAILLGTCQILRETQLEVERLQRIMEAFQRSVNVIPGLEGEFFRQIEKVFPELNPQIEHRESESLQALDRIIQRLKA